MLLLSIDYHHKESPLSYDSDAISIRVVAGASKLNHLLIGMVSQC